MKFETLAYKIVIEKKVTNIWFKCRVTFIRKEKYWGKNLRKRVPKCKFQVASIKLNISGNKYQVTSIW